jgi:hypothetical protein
MRHFLVTAAAMMALATFASAPAKADRNWGPIQQGNQCWTNSTSSKEFGYWGDCPKPASVAVAPVRHKSRHK